jgi:hypothetical protein
VHSSAADRVRHSRTFGYAAWSVGIRELCQPRAETGRKPVTESNLSLRLRSKWAIKVVTSEQCLTGKTMASAPKFVYMR